MRSENEQHEQVEPNSFRELQLLTELESSSDITQRKLSQRVGIALGLTNTLSPASPLRTVVPPARA